MVRRNLTCIQKHSLTQDKLKSDKKCTDISRFNIWIFKPCTLWIVVVAGRSVDSAHAEVAAIPEVVALNGDVQHRDGVGTGPSDVVV